MNELNYYKNSWPDEQQVLLLKAALLQGDEVIAAWEKWKSEINFDLIDPGSYRLLPMLYHNINKHGIKDPLINRLKGIYRRTWYENQMLSHKALEFLKLFHTKGIKTIVLKGISLLEIYYKDYGLRPMSDIDILIPTTQASDAFQLLKKSGWTPVYKSPTRIIPVIHSCEFTDPSGFIHLDLHWHLFIECCQTKADDDFWKGAQEIKIKDIPTHILNPADQLLHTCIHGMKWSVIPPFRWILDAIIIMNTSKDKIDWNRLLIQAQKRRLIMPLEKGLEFIIKNFNAPVPPEFFRELQLVPVSKAEQNEYKYKIENQKHTILGNIPVLWFDSMRLTGNKSLRHKIFGFLNYLRHFWDLDSLWQLPRQVLHYGVHKVGVMTRSKTP